MLIRERKRGIKSNFQELVIITPDHLCGDLARNTNFLKSKLSKKKLSVGSLVLISSATFVCVQGRLKGVRTHYYLLQLKFLSDFIMTNPGLLSRLLFLPLCVGTGG